MTKGGPHARAVDLRSLFQLPWERLEMSCHDIHDNGHRDDKVRDHQRGERVVKPQKLEHREQRDKV